MSRTPDLEAVAWRKSSYSTGGDENCIEVADGIPSVVPVRDSKAPQGPALLFPATAWSSFVTSVKTGELPST
jgi:hypothetical protein